LTPRDKAEEISRLFAKFPQITAVVLAGSQSTNMADSKSDIDLYIYKTGEISSSDQAEVINQAGGAKRSDLNMPYWGGTNMWIDRKTGICIDCIYFDCNWMEEQVNRVMLAHQASLGYSTCFCRTVNQSLCLYDHHGWFENLQRMSSADYPVQLQRNIILHNHPVLRTIMPSYLNQIESAIRRKDAVSVNHRVAALFASYFDIIFAMNRILHPGEKRIMSYIHKECTNLPVSIDKDIDAVLKTTSGDNSDLIKNIHGMLDRLDETLAESGLLPG
jgi:hypothetical protein